MVKRHVLSSKQVADVIAIACSPAPDGHDHRPLRLFSSSFETICVDTQT
ncbi:MAG TPA: hypothetical protein VF221_19760 [Chloroflexota bacterium]